MSRHWMMIGALVLTACGTEPATPPTPPEPPTPPPVEEKAEEAVEAVERELVEEEAEAPEEEQNAAADAEEETTEEEADAAADGAATPAPAPRKGVSMRPDAKPSSDSVVGGGAITATGSRAIIAFSKVETKKAWSKAFDRLTTACAGAGISTHYLDSGNSVSLGPDWNPSFPKIVNRNEQGYIVVQQGRSPRFIPYGDEGVTMASIQDYFGVACASSGKR